MKVISERNVEQALFSALILFRDSGVSYPSRNGEMIELPWPVTTVYYRPRERVVFDATRDCNPFLHFFESMWMLAGRNDTEFLRQFTKNMDQFSDDGRTLNGAYGHRWRTWFGNDQLTFVIHLLKNDPMTRRAVLGMWDPAIDLTNQSSKDLPCNTQVHFRLRDGSLDMSVINRSNDAIWGAYGANAVHFSFLQEYVASSVGAVVGKYLQISNSLHIYPDLEVTKRMMKLAGGSPPNFYSDPNQFGITPLLLPGEDPQLLDHDLRVAFETKSGLLSDRLQSNFMKTVARPMFNLWNLRNMADREDLENIARSIHSWDWRLNCIQWLNRRRDVKGLHRLRDIV